MYNKITEYGNRFIKHSDFMHVCSELKIELFGGRIDQKWLEYLDKNNILRPSIELVKPLWYLNSTLDNKTINPTKNIDFKNFILKANIRIYSIFKMYYFVIMNN